MAKRLNMRNLLTIVSVTVLVGVELIGAAIAAGWAVGGLLDLGRTVTLALMAVCCVLGVLGTVNFSRNAMKIEHLHD